MFLIVCYIVRYILILRDKILNEFLFTGPNHCVACMNFSFFECLKLLFSFLSCLTCNYISMSNRNNIENRKIYKSNTENKVQNVGLFEGATCLCELISRYLSETVCSKLLEGFIICYHEQNRLFLFCILLNGC